MNQPMSSKTSSPYPPRPSAMRHQAKRLSTTSTHSTSSMASATSPSSSSSSSNDNNINFQHASLPKIGLRAVSPRRTSALPATVDLTHAQRHCSVRCGSAADWEERYRRCSDPSTAAGGYVSFPDFDRARAESGGGGAIDEPSSSSSSSTASPAAGFSRSSSSSSTSSAAGNRTRRAK